MGRANEGFAAAADTFHHSWSLLNSCMVGIISHAAGLKPGQLESGEDVRELAFFHVTEKSQKADRPSPEVRTGKHAWGISTRSAEGMIHICQQKPEFLTQSRLVICMSHTEPDRTCTYPVPVKSKAFHIPSFKVRNSTVGIWKLQQRSERLHNCLSQHTVSYHILCFCTHAFRHTHTFWTAPMTGLRGKASLWLQHQKVMSPRKICPYMWKEVCMCVCVLGVEGDYSW